MPCIHILNEYGNPHIILSDEKIAKIKDWMMHNVGCYFENILGVVPEPTVELIPNTCWEYNSYIHIVGIDEETLYLCRLAWPFDMYMNGFSLIAFFNKIDCLQCQNLITSAGP